MSADPPARETPPSQTPELAANLADDWITIWQSEMNAAVTDRERLEAWSVLTALWANSAGAVAGAMSAPAGHEQARSSASNAQAGTASAPAAPDAGQLECERQSIAGLARRVEELERRLAAMAASVHRPG